MDKELLVSFSGGETSAFMCWWLHRNYEGNLRFVFANTSKEKEETLVFADKVDKKFGLNLVWLEAKFDGLKGVGYKVTNFDEAKRNGEVFEEMIKCYGIPNNAYPHCTRELKTQPITRWAKNNMSKDYWTAIGIRSDEVDRINAKRKKLRLYYPLVEGTHITKPHVNSFWDNMPFRLNLKGYEGNCDGCWKKSLNKLMQIHKDNPNTLRWWSEMECKYKRFVPPHRDRVDNGNNITFFRNNLSAEDIMVMSNDFHGVVRDDSKNYNIQTSLLDLDATNGCSDSCEPF